jgi:DNA-binding transcriptional LysR family regulator
MRITQLRRADLNLLVVFTVLAEERNVSRAAARLFLSQPAVSRALQRLRDMFHDDLLVRTAAGFEPTLQGQRLIDELEVMLPRLDRLLSGSRFNPEMEQARFRVAATDTVTSIVAPALCREVLPSAKKVFFEFVALRNSGFEDLTRGGLDLVLSPDDTYPPSQLQGEFIYEEELVCVVAAKSAYTRRLTIKEYLEAEHVGISGVAGSRFTPEKLLGAKGHKRRVVIRVPHPAAAIRCVPGRILNATVPRRLALVEQHNPAMRILQPPAQLSGLKYFMIWHPRVNTDAAHAWLRTAIRQIAKTSLA